MQLERTAFADGALEAVLRFDADEPLRTAGVPGFAAVAVAALPGLRGHRCDNGAGATFPAELADTEIAHFIEHAALEVMAMAGSPDTLRGLTTWDFDRDGRGVFCIRLEADDPAVAEGALAYACALARALVSGTEAPDAEQAARGLRDARRR